MIHVEAPALFQTAAQMNASVVDVWDQLNELRRQINILELNWNGGSKPEEFAEGMRAVLDRLYRHLDELDQLCLQLRRQAARWEESDLDWVREFQSVVKA